MKQITIFITLISLVFGGEKIASLVQRQIQQFPPEIQQQISKKALTWKHIPSNPLDRSMIDPSDLYGEWEYEDSDGTAYLTVGTDQQILNFLQLFGMKPAEGGIAISGTAVDTMDYIMLISFFDYEILFISNNPIPLDDEYDNVDVTFELPYYEMAYGSMGPSNWVEFVVADTLNGDTLIYEFEIENIGDLVSIDTTTFSVNVDTITFSNQDSDTTYTLNGIVSIGSLGLIAGVPTEIPFFGEDFGPDVGEDETMSMQFFEDGTGYEIYSEEDYYYNWDTTEFDWSATNDSLTLIFHEFDEDYYEEYDDTVTVAYEIIYLDSGTYVNISADFDFCEFIVNDDDDYINEDSCYADLEQFLSIIDIESITIDFWMEMSYVGPLAIDGEIGLYPDEFILHSAFPNPFNPTTTLKYELGSAGPVSIDVFDVNGRKIRSLYNGISAPGLHEIRWDARDNHGKQVSSGVYLFKVKMDGKVKTAKTLLLK